MRCESSNATSVTENMSESRRETLSEFLPNWQRRWAIVAGFIATVFLWAIVPAMRAQEKNPFAGDAKVAKLGEYQFRLNCAFCHGLGARGGGRGPDLSPPGTSGSVEYLAESVRSPSKRLAKGLSEPMKDFSQEYETATVVTPEGTKVQGAVLNEDSFTIQMLDTREELHSFEKAKLRSFEKTRESLMPAYDAKSLPEKDLKDLIAFLLAASEKGGAQ